MNETKDIIATIFFAAEKHKKQHRKGEDETPYINHPVKVAHLLITLAGVEDLDVIKAAILHDTIEDTETTKEELIESFGERIAELVAEVSDDKSLPKQERKQLQISDATKKSFEAKLIKLADKICNLEDILYAPPKDWDNKRKLEYFEWAEKVCNGLSKTNSGSNTNDALVSRINELLIIGKKKFSS